MKPVNKLFLMLLIGLLLLVSMTASVSHYEEPYIMNSEPSDNHSTQPAGDRLTRSSMSTRQNFQIISTTPVTMPEENESWIQDDWSGGGGQHLWIDDSKYNLSDNINDTSSNGPLSLSEGEDVDAWEQLPDGFGGRYRHRMVWSSTRKVFYTFGGVAANTNVVNELYEYNPANGVWTQKGQFGGPSSRCSALVVYDTESDLLWVYGGRDRANPSGTQYNDLWAYNPGNDQWTQKSSGPGARSDAAGVFNPNTGEIIVYGGYIGGTEFSSNQVFVYNTQTDNWIMKKSYTKRYYHGAAWCPKTNSMFVYGGAVIWSGDYTYVTELNEYFPATDTWVNRTPTTKRVRPVVVWDTLNNKLIVHGGGEPDRNDTWVYDTDTDSWERKSDGPNPARDRVGGDWDPVRNRLVTFGGTINEVRTDDVFVYYPNVTGYEPSGELTSSIFNPGYSINPKTVLFNITKPLPPKLGSRPVKIQLAGSQYSPGDADIFVGPNGLTTSYFYQESGHSVPSELAKSRYLAYKVILSTGNRMSTPELNWVRIDYYTYPDSYTFISAEDQTNKDGLPLRFLDWTSKEPENTDLEIYFRQSYYDDLSSKSWEMVSKGQSEFGYKGGKYFQYKAVLITDDPCTTPELSTITFTFNAVPSKPELVSPQNQSWVNDSKPQLSWVFNDPDTSDYQTGFEVAVSSEETFSIIAHETGTVESLKCSHKITSDLNDGKYYWRVRAKDNYGSWGPWSVSNLLFVDTGKPTLPTIESFSHPLTYIWYNNNQVYLHWNEPSDPSGIAGYSFSLDSVENAEPETSIMMTADEFGFKYNASDFKGLVGYDNVPDGIWYFHLKSVDSLGTWSDTATRIVKVDTAAPDIIDLTPKNAIPGKDLLFNFKLNDSGSGVDLVTIYWKYSSDSDFEYFDFLQESVVNYTFLHTVQITPDPYIEYYLEATDKSEPVNILRYPNSGYIRVNIIDNEPPVILNCTGSKTHNKFNNLEITVTAVDNTGISSVTLYLNDQAIGRSMTKILSDTFIITLDRAELDELAQYSGGDRIYYKIEVWDYHNNSAVTPDSGNYNITLSEIDEKDDTSKKESGEDEFSKELTIYLIVLILMIIVIAVTLFLFIRKQSEKMGEDRHKLRMAIADVQEAASSATANLATAPAGIQPIAPPQEPGQGQFPSIESPSASTTYLPPATVLSQTRPEPAAQEADIKPMEQAGLQTPVESTEEKKVKIDDDLFLTLPDNSK
ncbi:MAG: hypothetical protein JSV49_02630 [Thermoplasmata archaeon]|nr:MAG: hypothetical protein JSV49_02630 [Thermoplasmata archaeon]